MATSKSVRKTEVRAQCLGFRLNGLGFKEYTVGKVEGKINKHSLKTESAVNEQVGIQKGIRFTTTTNDSNTTILYYTILHQTMYTILYSSVL